MKMLFVKHNIAKTELQLLVPSDLLIGPQESLLERVDASLKTMKDPLPGTKLSELFPEYNPDYIAIVAVAHIQAGIDALTPSSTVAKPLVLVVLAYEQEHHPIYNGRPAHLHGPSVTLDHSVLAELKDALDDPSATTPTALQLQLTQELFPKMSAIYDTENERINITKPVLEALLGSVDIDKIHKVTGDGLIKWKNELGSPDDGGIQAALTYRKHIVQSVYTDIRHSSCCPCLLISVMGAYICIFGAVFVDQVVVQPFTEYIWLGGDPYYETWVVSVARIFHATASAVAGLQAYYRNLVPSTVPDPARLLPQPTFIDNAASPLFRLQYHGYLPTDSRKALFLAIKDDTKLVTVKFTYRYCEMAHRHLADHQLAPSLYFCSRIRGGLWMVVMALADGEDASRFFKGRDLSLRVREDVGRAVDLLHDKGLVYGDLRRPNIMVVKKPALQSTVEGSPSEDGEPGGMLVDFDWPARDGEGLYPATVVISNGPLASNGWGS
ncbi:hypothetical protein B0H21DRAFT_827183 [Amylocystis lapponica]|nr:hypothetical protein B0H21DRAFT_827183 [Amylocystis lapponica]